jgi:hypothetical protein
MGSEFAESLEAIGAVEDTLDPRGVIEIPADGLAEAALEILLRGPAKLGAGAAGIDGVTEVVTGSIGDVGDRGGVRLAVSTRTELVEKTSRARFTRSMFRRSLSPPMQ